MSWIFEEKKLSVKNKVQVRALIGKILFWNLEFLICTAIVLHQNPNQHYHENHVNLKIECPTSHLVWHTFLMIMKETNFNLKKEHKKVRLCPHFFLKLNLLCMHSIPKRESTQTNKVNVLLVRYPHEDNIIFH